MRHSDYYRRETDSQRGLRKEQNSMIRTRLLLGSMALSHSLSALFLPTQSALFILSSVWSLSYWLPVLLGAFSTIMIAAALAEHYGHSYRNAHEFSASMLAAMWTVVWAYSWDGGADYITFLAPVHIFFIGWAVVSEAQVQRHKITKPVIFIED